MRIRYFHYQLAEATAKGFSKLTAFFLARGIARAYSHFSPDGPALRLTLAAALNRPENSPEVRRAVQRLALNYSAYLVELFYANRLVPDFVKHRVDLDALDRLDSALAKGRGAVIVSGHVGNWEMGAMTMAILGYPVSVIALTHRNPGIEAVFLNRRARAGIRTLALGQFMRPAYQLLARNEAVAMNADRLFGGGGIRVRFMGTDVLFPSGFARIAAASGAALLPTFFMVTGGRYVLDIRPPIDTGDLRSAVQAFAVEVESTIRRYPDQWYVFQRFTEEAIWPA